ncbi:trans-aconitate 2-methyltransferase [Actinopolymorpha sp. B17G11]|uniref:trans-aconitate 2-methyltransferase n=1 Tax=Actinopolymorpha sp. B17G11 TaxID=3160861 RepID=UPI0032E49111
MTTGSTAADSPADGTADSPAADSAAAATTATTADSAAATTADSAAATTAATTAESADDSGLAWDPGQYLKYADERGRPFADLLARVGARDPRYVVDMGCGPGQLTAGLCARWPDADIEGVDSSVPMIERAQALRDQGETAASTPAAGETGRLSFRLGDLRDWRPERPVDVLITNATLQWVPGHVDLLPTWVSYLARDGWLALQVPGNFDSPSHRTLFALAAEEPWARHLTVPVRQRPSAPGPDVYLDVLAAAGCQVDAWETTYLHVLQGEDAVFEWVKGTGARPVLQALPDDVRPDFEAAYKARLREAYPPRDVGTVLPYRRVFAVARRVGR